jgi:hypothetical protein
MMPVKPQISKFQAGNLAKWALTCYGGFTHECLLSEAILPYLLAYRVTHQNRYRQIRDTSFW